MATYLDGNLDIALAKGSSKSLKGTRLCLRESPSRLFLGNHYRGISRRLIPLHRVIPDSYLRGFSPQSCFHRVLLRDPRYPMNAMVPSSRARPKPDHRCVRPVVHLDFGAFWKLGPIVGVKDAQKLGLYPGHDPDSLSLDRHVVDK